MAALDKPATQNTKEIAFTDIQWETDVSDAGMPTTVSIVVDADDDTDFEAEGADILSDKYGFCVVSFCVQVVHPSKQLTKALAAEMQGLRDVIPHATKHGARETNISIELLALLLASYDNANEGQVNAA